MRRPDLTRAEIQKRRLNHENVVTQLQLVNEIFQRYDDADGASAAGFGSVSRASASVSGEPDDEDTEMLRAHVKRNAGVAIETSLRDRHIQEAELLQWADGALSGQRLNTDELDFRLQELTLSDAVQKTQQAAGNADAVDEMTDRLTLAIRLLQQYGTRLVKLARLFEQRELEGADLRVAVAVEVKRLHSALDSMTVIKGAKKGGPNQSSNEGKAASSMFSTSQSVNAPVVQDDAARTFETEQLRQTNKASVTLIQAQEQEIAQLNEDRTMLSERLDDALAESKRLSKLLEDAQCERVYSTAFHTKGVQCTPVHHLADRQTQTTGAGTGKLVSMLQRASSNVSQLRGSEGVPSPPTSPRSAADHSSPLAGQQQISSSTFLESPRHLESHHPLSREEETLSLHDALFGGSADSPAASILRAFAKSWKVERRQRRCAEFAIRTLVSLVRRYRAENSRVALHPTVAGPDRTMELKRLREQNAQLELKTKFREKELSRAVESQYVLAAELEKCKQELKSIQQAQLQQQQARGRQGSAAGNQGGAAPAEAAASKVLQAPEQLGVIVTDLLSLTRQLCTNREGNHEEKCELVKRCMVHLVGGVKELSHAVKHKLLPEIAHVLEVAVAETKRTTPANQEDHHQEPETDSALELARQLMQQHQPKQSTDTGSRSGRKKSDTHSGKGQSAKSSKTPAASASGDTVAPWGDSIDMGALFEDSFHARRDSTVVSVAHKAVQCKCAAFGLREVPIPPTLATAEPKTETTTKRSRTNSETSNVGKGDTKTSTANHSKASASDPRRTIHMATHVISAPDEQATAVDHRMDALQSLFSNRDAVLSLQRSRQDIVGRTATRRIEVDGGGGVILRDVVGVPSTVQNIVPPTAMPQPKPAPTDTSGHDPERKAEMNDVDMFVVGVPQGKRPLSARTAGARKSNDGESFKRPTTVSIRKEFSIPVQLAVEGNEERESANRPQSAGARQPAAGRKIPHVPRAPLTFF